MRQLNDNYLAELFKAAFRSVPLMDVMSEHVKFQYLPSEEWKTVWKAMHDFYSVRKSLITPGVVCEQYSHDSRIVELIAEINNAQSVDIQVLIEQLESFVMQKRFVELYNSLGDLWNQNRRDEAIALMQKTAPEIVFTTKRRIQKSQRLFGDFIERISANAQRQVEFGKFKIPFSIDALDEITKGGIEQTDTCLFTAQSGVGKTKCLRWIATNAARRGYQVKHYQLEGSEDQCLEGYDALWTSLTKTALRFGDLTEQDVQKALKAISDITSNGGEVHIKAFEQFDSATTGDLYDDIDNHMVAHGRLHFVSLDYLEKVQPVARGRKEWRWGPAEERARREAVAEQVKNIATEFQLAVATATQASTVEPVLLNNPNYVMTRYNIAEFKALINSFSYHITLNQTKDEYNEKMMRLYVDKLRHEHAGQTVSIYQAYDRERFYDGPRTRKFILNNN